MLTIVPIQPHQIEAAKSIIAAVAQRIFEPDLSPQEFLRVLIEEHELDDVDQVSKVYAEDGGLFLVVLDDGKVIGTGAIRKLENNLAELKRLWLLEPYHGRGIGYRVVSQLFDFARQHGYQRLVLQTSLQQQRAIAFYRRLGFVEAPAYNELPYDDDISMEIRL